MTNRIAVIVLAVVAHAGVAIFGLHQTESVDAQTPHFLNMNVARHETSIGYHSFPYHKVTWRASQTHRSIQ